MANYVKPQRVLLRAHPEYTEKWVQTRIAEDPSILEQNDAMKSSSN